MDIPHKEHRFKRIKTTMIHAILIANRGEIAHRIIQTCRKLGIQAISVFSDADREAPYVAASDLAVYIGDSPPAASYLDQETLIRVALQQGADAIHPGYGFLSENAVFARRVKEAGLIFIGPHAEAIEQMGSKSRAKAIMEASHVPVIPGYRGTDQSPGRLHEEAEKTGLPILIKAAAGGGGKGMRIVHHFSELDALIQAAKREALAAFGDDELLIEKYFPSARHIEFQIFGDQHGQAFHLLERECSIQRRYQKIIEESPSPVMLPALREKMGKAAVQAAKAIGYDNAGTVEFIYTGPETFYFLEVNTRLQVEHPVTECITGLDLVEWQIRVAEGEALPWKQEEIQATGYAIQCRLYAEDPAQHFLPATGKVLHWETPDLEGLRYDTAVESGSRISIFYDPMIAKIIAHGPNRRETIRRMRYALGNMACLGLSTNQAFLLQLLRLPDFENGNYDTGFLLRHPELQHAPAPGEKTIQHALIAVAIQRWQERQNQKERFRNIPSGWRNNFYQHQQESYLVSGNLVLLQYRCNAPHFEILLDGQSFSATWVESQKTSVTLIVEDCRMKVTLVGEEDRYFVLLPGTGPLTIEPCARFPEADNAETAGSYAAPMPGEVVKIIVQPGQEVEAGDALIVLSSMKMENTISAFEKGTVAEILVEAGQRVETGTQLIRFRSGTD